MALASGTVWEVRTTGNANNGGGFIDRLPGTSIDYSQQNASQLSCTDLACLAASVTITSVIGGFTPGMVGNLIQIRSGVNFTVGFYEIVQFNSANSINVDRVPVTANGTGGNAEVGGALASVETFLLSGVSGNFCFVKSGAYNFTATRIQAAASFWIFGYDTSRDSSPTGANRPLIDLGAFWIQTASALLIENVRFTGSATQLILGKTGNLKLFNCSFENTNAAGNRYCIYFDNGGASFSPRRTRIVDCEFSGTAGATSYGFYVTAQTANENNIADIVFSFCFFHDLSYGFFLSTVTSFSDSGETFYKCTFARMDATAISMAGGSGNMYPVMVLFSSFYQAGSYFILIENKPCNFIYGNTFEGAVVAAIRDNVANNTWIIDNNNFWNNGASVINVPLGSGNIGLDPLFVNPAGNDFNFGPGSPCIANAIGIRLGV